jgi:hypothetical protein
MSSIPNQVLRCTGELRIDNGGEINKELRGTLRFVDNNTTYGQLRVYGFSGFGELVLDSVNVSQGFNVRTQTIQGGSYLGGSNEPYALQVINLQTKMRNLQVADYKSQYNQQTGQNIFIVQRSSTEDSYSTTQKNFTIGGFSQQQFKVGEGVFQYTGCTDRYSSWFGFRSVAGSGFSNANYGVMGVAYDGTLAEAIRMKSDGSVECPVKISAPIIEGTSIVGVDFLPLTLEKIDGHVGINQLNPTEALDVVGNVKVSNQITASTIYADTYLNYPIQDLSPITLDPINDRVGINKTTPTEALDVIGNATVSGTLSVGAGASTADQTTLLKLNSSRPWIFKTQNDGKDIALQAMTDGKYFYFNDTAGAPIASFLAKSTNTPPNAVFIDTTLFMRGNLAQLSGATSLKALTATTVTCSGMIDQGSNAAALAGLVSPTGYFGLNVTGNSNTYRGIVVGSGVNGNTPYIASSKNGNGVAGPLHFQTDATTRLAIDASGNVGIRTTAPAYDLDVNGSCRASNLTLNTATVTSSTGTPEGVLAANVGSLYLRGDGGTGTTLYVKESGTGNTGWKTVGGGGSSAYTMVQGIGYVAFDGTSQTIVPNFTLTSGNYTLTLNIRFANMNVDSFYTLQVNAGSQTLFQRYDLGHYNYSLILDAVSFVVNVPEGSSYEISTTASVQNLNMYSAGGGLGYTHMRYIKH